MMCIYHSHISSAPAVFEMARATGIEVRAKFNNYTKHQDYSTHKSASCWSPVINIMRDPRWGRNQVIKQNSYQDWQCVSLQWQWQWQCLVDKLWDSVRVLVIENYNIGISETCLISTPKSICDECSNLVWRRLKLHFCCT